MQFVGVFQKTSRKMKGKNHTYYREGIVRRSMDSKPDKVGGEDIEGWGK